MPFDIGGFVYNTSVIQDYGKGGIVTDGLVLHLDAAYGNSYPKGGTTWYDLSGNSNNGTLTNGPTYSSGDGGSIVFDGSNDYASVTSVTPIIGDFTVGFIYQLTGINGRGGLFERKVTSPYNGFSFGQGGTNNWAATISGTSDFNNRISVTFTYPTINTWYHDVFIYSNGNTITGYRNGSFVSSATGISQGNLSSQGTRSNFLIANRDNSISLPCVVANVTVYNRALSSTEIAQNYNAQKDRFIYQPLTFSTSGNTTLVTNSNGSLTIYKGAGSDAWDSQGYSNQSFTAPCTLEFYKISEAADNGRAYAMIGWNVDPTANASYTNIDIAVYPYRSNTLRLYSNGSNLGDVGSWDITKKFYMSYDTDGYVRIWNGSNLLYTYNYGTGKTVYVDSSLNRVHPIYSRFSEIRVVNASWNGVNYEK